MIEFGLSVGVRAASCRPVRHAGSLSIPAIEIIPQSSDSVKRFAAFFLKKWEVL
jgi:hypothetical protein